MKESENSKPIQRERSPWKDENYQRNMVEYRSVLNLISSLEAQTVSLKERAAVLRVEIMEAVTNSPLDYTPQEPVKKIRNGFIGRITGGQIGG